VKEEESDDDEDDRANMSRDEESTTTTTTTTTTTAPPKKRKPTTATTTAPPKKRKPRERQPVKAPPVTYTFGSVNETRCTLRDSKLPNYRLSRDKAPQELLDEFDAFRRFLTVRRLVGGLSFYLSRRDTPSLGVNSSLSFAFAALSSHAKPKPAPPKLHPAQAHARCINERTTSYDVLKDGILVYLNEAPTRRARPRLPSRT
jgi:hypothetical protein